MAVLFLSILHLTYGPVITFQQLLMGMCTGGSKRILCKVFSPEPDSVRGMRVPTTPVAVSVQLFDLRD